jgi:hypothetical protein
MGRAGSCQERLAGQTREAGGCRAFCDTFASRGAAINRKFR